MTMLAVHEADKTDQQAPAPPRLAWRSLGVVIGVAAVVHLAVLTRYGWHRDEFYYVISGRHLAWGYPDQPPLTPVLARMLAVGGLTGVRLGALAAHLGCMVAAAALAAEMGGRRRAQVLTAAAVAACPMFMGASLLFGTTVMDQLFWVLILLLVARALRRPTPWAWLAAGAVAGLGLEDKQTVLVLLAGIAVGLAVTRRSALRSPWPWAAGSLAFIIWLPNLVWDAVHGWPNVKMASVLSSQSGGPLAATIALPLVAVVLVGPLLLPLWWTGARRLASEPQRSYRWLLLASAVTVLVFTASGGKFYYPTPALYALFAAGAIAIEERTAGRRLSWTGWPLALAVTFSIGAILTLPILPPRAASKLRAIDPPLIETYGWPRLASEVATAARSAPGATIVFTSNYGEAGAVTFYGRRFGLDLPVASGHNAYGDWGPPSGSDDNVLAVGEFDQQYLEGFWSSVTEILPITQPKGIVDQETAQHAAVFLCQDPHGTWAELWPSLRRLD